MVVANVRDWARGGVHGGGDSERSPQAALYGAPLMRRQENATPGQTSTRQEVIVHDDHRGAARMGGLARGLSSVVALVLPLRGEALITEGCPA